MTVAQLANFNRELAQAEKIAEQRKKALEDVSAEDILSFSLKRELRAVEVEGVGRVYVYEPQSVAEKNAYQKHVKYDGEFAKISLDGMVDGIIARVRNSDGKPLFEQSQRAKLFEMSAEVLATIWNALGAETVTELTSDAAAKK